MSNRSYRALIPDNRWPDSPRPLPRFEVRMIAEAKQSYRGVICIHCHQPTPLTPAAEHKEKKFEAHGKQESEEFTIFSNPMRCRWCHGEAVYAPKDVGEFEDSPRKRMRRYAACFRRTRVIPRQSNSLWNRASIAGVRSNPSSVSRAILRRRSTSKRAKLAVPKPAPASRTRRFGRRSPALSSTARWASCERKNELNLRYVVSLSV